VVRYAQEIFQKKTTNWFKTNGLRQSYKEGFRKKGKDSISPSDTIIKGNKKSEESIFRRKVRYKADKYAKLIKTNLLLYIRQNSIIKI
jgi:hypothetical protein